MIGVSAQRVSALVAAGVLRDGATGGEWLHSYCERLRAEAAKHSVTSLTEARTRFEVERTKSLEIKNRIAEREYASVSLLTRVIAATGAKINSIFDGIPGQIRLRWPDVTSEQLRFVEGEITRARDLVSKMRLDDVMPDDESDEQVDDTAEPAQ